ncbi:hypothetical protein AALP_AA2G078800 [Arabis alpina]|uniref:Kinesin motor domain-containing protein n=1 Tax=Arabis alpina TaxID=50452 RepID=A0A087HFZ7_ARAAL|nr:hypothetical protein AALP_AA2G078800 [Arabis alpina]
MVLLLNVLFREIQSVVIFVFQFHIPYRFDTLKIRNSYQKGPSVPDASLIPVSSTFDVIDLMKVGHKNRAVGSTPLNDRSSRCHSCMNVHVQGRDSTSGAILCGCIHLVDLACSKRLDKSKVTGDRLK